MSKFRKLRPSQIEIDPRFNRDLDETRAKAMSRKIELDLIGVPVVSDRGDGKYVALDGQHRIAACRMAGVDEPILCEIYTGLSLPEEAAKFLRLNGSRTAVRAFDKFKARLVAKDPVALEIEKILKAAGLRVAKAPGRYTVCAIQAVESVYHRGQNLPDVLSVLVIWSEGDSTFMDGLLIRALSLFLGKYPNVDLKELGRKLAPYSAERVISKLQRMQGAFKDVSATVAACSVFRDIYNTKRPRKTQLPPPDGFQEATASSKPKPNGTEPSQPHA